MAKEVNQNQGENQQTARPCPKDCSKCGFQQHAYCAAQMSFYLVEKVNALQIQIQEQGENMLTINKQINALKSEKQSEELINPIQDITQ